MRIAPLEGGAIRESLTFLHPDPLPSSGYRSGPFLFLFFLHLQLRGDNNFDPAVLVSALLRIMAGHGLIGGAANGFHVFRFQAGFFLKIPDNGRGSSCGELPVGWKLILEVLTDWDIIGMADDADPFILDILERLSHLRQNLFPLGFEGGFTEIEKNLIHKRYG